MLINKTEEISENYGMNLKKKKKTSVISCDKLDEKCLDINSNRVRVILYSVYFSSLSTGTGTLVAN